MSMPIDHVIEFLAKNSLFEGFTEQELRYLAPLFYEEQFEAGQYIFHEGTTPTQLFLVVSGEATVFKKDPETGVSYRLASHQAGAVLGETSILAERPHSASVQAVTAVNTLTISLSDLKGISDAHNPRIELAKRLKEASLKLEASAHELSLRGKLLRNVASEMRQRLENTNNSYVETLRLELSQTRVRVAMGNLIIGLLVLISMYVLSAQTIHVLIRSLPSTTMVSVPLMGIFALGTFVLMRRSSYPMRFYGITLEEWRASLIQSIYWTAIIIVGACITKAVIIHFDPEFHHLHLIDTNISVGLNPTQSAQLSKLDVLLLLVLYLVLTPLQELMYRGLLQSSLTEFLVGPRRALWAILISNLIFSVTHTHISVGLGLAVFFPGIIWGWMYHCHRTLVGVTFSHLVVGFVAFFILNLQGILGFY